MAWHCLTIADRKGFRVCHVAHATGFDVGEQTLQPLSVEAPLGYRLAEHTLAFTLTMKIARLVMAAITSLAAGALVRWIAPASRLAPWIVGLVTLALFLPAHIQLWHRFPLWYHLSFLVPLVPLVVLGAWLVSAQRAPTQLPVGSNS